MTPEDERRRGEDARRVLAEPVYKEAWQAYEKRLLDELASAARTEDEVRTLRGLLIASRKARAHLERIMAEGNMAAANIALIEKQRKRFGLFRAA